MSRATKLYEPYRKYPELFGNIFLESWFHPDMIELVATFQKQYQKQLKQQQSTNNDNTINQNDEETSSHQAAISKLSPYLRIESDGVYSFQCFNEHFLQIFNEEIQNFYSMSDKYNIHVRRPNSSKFG